MKHPGSAKIELGSLVIDTYLVQPELLLASLDIFDKPNIYHIRPQRIWLNRIKAANDRHHLQIDVSAADTAPLAGSDFLEEVTSFTHKVIKNYAFRYVDYLWTQRYKISFSDRSDVNIVVSEGNDIVINIHSLINQTSWKPALYLSLGYAVMLAILRSSEGDNKKENIYLAMMKTWNRYLSFDESTEQKSVRDLCGLHQFTEEGERRSLLQCMTDKEGLELVDDLITLMDYSAKETFAERLKVLNESRYEHRTGVYYEQLWERGP